MIAYFSMSIRHLHTDDDFREFARGFSTALETRTRGALKGNVPISYLRASKVTGVFDREGRMVAGYVIGIAQPLRLLEFVPPEARRSLSPPTGARWEDCCEIACFWKKPEVPSFFMATRVWPRTISEAVGSGRRFVLGHNQSTRLDSLYMKAKTGSTLYLGPSVYDVPSRLTAYDARNFKRDALRVVAVVTARRVMRNLWGGSLSK